MSFEVGDILLVKNFKLPSEVKDKFFVVLDRKGDDYAILSMTTSQQYICDEKIQHGIIADGDVVVYCLLKSKHTARKYKKIFESRLNDLIQ